MRTMTINDFNTNALKVINDLVNSREHVIITQKGKPVAELIPYTEPVQTAG